MHLEKTCSLECLKVETIKTQTSQHKRTVCLCVVPQLFREKAVIKGFSTQISISMGVLCLSEKTLHLISLLAFQHGALSLASVSCCYLFIYVSYFISYFLLCCICLHSSIHFCGTLCQGRWIGLRLLVCQRQRVTQCFGKTWEHQSCFCHVPALYKLHRFSQTFISGGGRARAAREEFLFVCLLLTKLTELMIKDNDKPHGQQLLS